MKHRIEPVIGEVMLAGHDVTLTLGDAQILRGVDVEVRAGEVLALVGPNGAGKSTLLGVLAGDHTPTNGDVRLRGESLRSFSSQHAARERGVLMQKQTLSFGFVVRDVVMMGRAPWHRSPQSDLDEAIVDEAIKRADVGHLTSRHFPTLSGGEQGRTAFARLLAQDTPVLMLDEPTAALDIHHQEQVLSVVREAADAGAAVVVVLHDLSLAAAYADQVCVLARGEVRALGRPDDVLTSDLLSEVYSHPVQVLRHEGQLVVVPVRRPSKEGA
ncbi:heme ABC transporter ATP-binding protein [Nocardioides alcanivorans]|uniref:heme ABC transporter ATP-binding protein n=1 Tax=Nocardioides alcanivorans TaxID=2897352 RepID=UPI001F271D9A|nr:heme ABC transporter ATP-binding protein [Nocardioides alcanivorans]